MSSLEIKADTRPLMHYIELLKRYFDVTFEISDGALHLDNLFDEASRLEVDYGSAGTGEITVTFYPSDSFLDFFAAITARNLEFFSV